MNVGTEWLVDAEDCSPELLRDVKTVRRLCEEIIAALDLRVVGDPMFHKFPQPGGVTGLYLLTESHLACHTFPESGQATFNLYCCRPRQPFNWEERLRELLGANRVTVRTVARGAEPPAGLASIKPADIESLEAATPVSFEAQFPDPTPAREVSGL